ncbi:neural cell adhesion molecule 1-like [Myripristis murdjan]|uniref:neural cell adhesion molecule 1-like n=1 Tax=Myripristis murdjan TaxID=586833 RepID=UPI0011763B5C|nr:neural cell adhesion molecule 1-like [Myripristis murdjan]
MLTLTNITPADQGNYTCKLHSDIGAEHNTSVVTVQECRGSSAGYMNDSQAECRFYGVYPTGTVHWFQDGANLTGSAKTHIQEDQNRLFNVKSTIQIWPGNKTQLYNCSLWIPSMRKYLSSTVVTVEKSSYIQSSGSMIKLQWIMVGTLMIKFIM